MKEAIKQAINAKKNGEVPIGAVVVYNNKVLSKAYNSREKNNIATSHAEILAIERACKKLRTWRLDNCEIYVTLEPCLMCLGAILNSRIKKLIFGAYDNKTDLKQFYLSKNNSLNHNLEVVGGVCETECKRIIEDFFKKVRKN